MSQPQYSGPTVSEEVPWHTRRHIQLLYQKIAELSQAITLQQQQIAAMKSTTSTGSGS